MVFEVESIEDLENPIRAFNQLKQFDVILLQGDMGSGKTTFTKNLLANWGVQDVVSSPTYSIVNEYVGADGEPIYHFDLYRIKDIEELLDMGFEDYLDQGISIIEWPEIAEPLLPKELHRISFTNREKSRKIEIEN